MTKQTEPRRAERTRRIRAIMATAQALADGKDPADFPEFGFSPRVERLAEIFRETELREAELSAVTLRFDDPVSRPALALYAEALEAHEPDKAAKIQDAIARSVAADLERLVGEG